MVLEAEAPDQHQEDAHPQAPGAWDASDDARRDAAGAADLRRELADEAAEKLAGRARGVRAQDASSLPELQLARWARPDAAAELCTPDAVPSAEQSCAAQEAVAELPLQGAQADVARLSEAVARLKR